ncbi:MAG TPA: serine hydrolase [Candidatus Dormibacteraeota bacterium]|nr:serine hydrolase [Candidatus Dormibacteraeota bacterium]
MSFIATALLVLASTLAPVAALPPELNHELVQASAGLEEKALPSPTTATTPVPVKSGTEPLQLGAASVYAIDVQTGQALFGKQPNDKRAIASVTKMATALAIIKRHDLKKTVTIPPLPAYKPEDHIIGLKPGQQFTMGDLLAALLVASANDAADALAIIDSGSQEAFADTMNTVPKQWGVEGTNFNNPSGLVDEGNYATAKSLAQMGGLLIQNQTARSLVGTRQQAIYAASGQRYDLATTDQLLAGGKFKGIKTGYTPAAGQCFVGLTETRGHEVITVVLGSTDRFGETAKLAGWIERNYTWQ